MLGNTPPQPKNESERILELSSLDLDYSMLEDNFKDLTKLAAKITGKPIALINLIDSFTQWTISNHGLPLKSSTRSESVCQYTIANDADFFEIKNLLEDERFKNRPYVNTPDGLRYYLGVQLKGNDGSAIGSLCVVDSHVSELTPDQIDILKIIAGEIVKRLYEFKNTRKIYNKFTAAQEETKTLARNVREPLAGVIGILQVIMEDAAHNQLNSEILQYMHLIQQSSNAMLSLTDAVLDNDEEKQLNEDQGNLIWLKTTIEALYLPICKQKNIDLKINVSERTQLIPLFKSKLLQVAGNLISYAIANTTDAETITLNLFLKVNVTHNVLHINLEFVPVADDMINSVFKNEEYIIKEKNTEVQALQLISKLVNSLGGKIETGIITTNKRKIDITLPQI
jgi:hypothetical protein